jgi:hypothetical protein
VSSFCSLLRGSIGLYTVPSSLESSAWLAMINYAPEVVALVVKPACPVQYG